MCGLALVKSLSLPRCRLKDACNALRSRLHVLCFFIPHLSDHLPLQFEKANGVDTPGVVAKPPEDEQDSRLAHEEVRVQHLLHCVGHGEAEAHGMS